jgi:hypothetical protein
MWGRKFAERLNLVYMKGIKHIYLVNYRPRLLLNKGWTIRYPGTGGGWPIQKKIHAKSWTRKKKFLQALGERKKIRATS